MEEICKMFERKINLQMIRLIISPCIHCIMYVLIFLFYTFWKADAFKEMNIIHVYIYICV